MTHKNAKLAILTYASPEPNTGCWLWIGCDNGKKGYGRIHIGRHKMAHRVAYEAFIGPIPTNMQVHHTCEVKACVNPDHLRLITGGDHQRLHGPSRTKSHCKRGHSLDDAYVYNKHNTVQRICRTCSKEKRQ